MLQVGDKALLVLGDRREYGIVTAITDTEITVTKNSHRHLKFDPRVIQDGFYGTYNNHFTSGYKLWAGKVRQNE